MSGGYIISKERFKRMSIMLKMFSLLSVFYSGMLFAQITIIHDDKISVTNKDVSIYIDNLVKSEPGQELNIDSAMVSRISDLIFVTRALALESENVDVVDNSLVTWLGDFQIDSVLKEALLNVEVSKNLSKLNLDVMAADLYEKKKNQFLTEEELNVAHILLKNRGKSDDEVKASIGELRERALVEDFLTLAEEVSEDPSAIRNRGELGFFGRGKMVKAFETAAFSLKKGEISQPIKTPFGYHLLKLLDRKGGDPKPFEEVKSKIIEEIKKQVAANYRRERLDKVLERPEVKFNDTVARELVAKYRGNNKKDD